jgi:hypothetical protein
MCHTCWKWNYSKSQGASAQDCMILEILKANNIKIMVLQDVTPSNLVERSSLFWDVKPCTLVITKFFMEDFEERALEQATHYPLWWIHYADDTLSSGHMDQRSWRDFWTTNKQGQPPSLLRYLHVQDTGWLTRP